MSYEITITKIEIQEIESGSIWTQVGEALLDESDLKQSIYDGSVVSRDEVRLKKVFGYTPKITKMETITIEIYRQIVPELDLPAVIRAVNKLEDRQL